MKKGPQIDLTNVSHDLEQDFNNLGLEENSSQSHSSSKGKLQASSQPRQGSSNMRGTGKRKSSRDHLNNHNSNSQ